MDIIEQLEWRYAVKRFDPDRKVSKKHLTRLKHAFNLTATSYGLQPVRLVVVSNGELQKRLMAHTFGQRQIVEASHILVFCAERDVDAGYITKYFERVKQVRDTDETILAPYRASLIREFEAMSPTAILEWAKNQVYLALGNMLTVCAVEGIDSCPMEGFEPQAYDELLDLAPLGLTSVLVLPIGYRAKDDMFSDFSKVRRPLDESVIDIG